MEMILTMSPKIFKECYSQDFDEKESKFIENNFQPESEALKFDLKGQILSGILFARMVRL